MRTLVACAIGFACGIFAFTIAAGIVGSLVAASVIAIIIAAIIAWACRARPFVPIDEAACSRGLKFVALVATVAALVQLTRLAVFMVDPSKPSYSQAPASDWEVRHSCLSAYFVAARAADHVPNIYADSLYTSPDDDPTTVRKALMIGQLAFTLILLVGAGLFVQTVAHLYGEAAFPSSRLLMLSVNPPASGYPASDAEQAMREVLRRLQETPDVERVAIANTRILDGGAAATTLTIQSDHRIVSDGAVARMRVGSGRGALVPFRPQLVQVPEGGPLRGTLRHQPASARGTPAGSSHRQR